MEFLLLWGEGYDDAFTFSGTAIYTLSDARVLQQK